MKNNDFSYYMFVFKKCNRRNLKLFAIMYVFYYYYFTEHIVIFKILIFILSYLYHDIVGTLVLTYIYGDQI